MTCPFKRCSADPVHCNGACHGVTPDGIPASEEYMASLERVETRPTCNGGKPGCNYCGNGPCPLPYV